MIKEDGSFLLMIKRRKRKDGKEEEETDHPAHDPILLTSPSLHPLHTLSAALQDSPPHRRTRTSHSPSWAECVHVCVCERACVYVHGATGDACVCVRLYVCARTLGQAVYAMIHTLKEAYFLSLFKWSSVAAADVLSIALLVVASEVRVAVLSGSCVCVCSVSVPSERVTSAE